MCEIELPGINQVIADSAVAVNRGRLGAVLLVDQIAFLMACTCSLTRGGKYGGLERNTRTICLPNFD